MKKYISNIIVVKIIVITMLFAMLTMSGCVCGPKEKKAVWVDTKYGHRMQIVFWHSMAGKLGEVLNKMIDEFNRTNTGEIFIKSEFIGEYGTLNQKIAAAVFAEIPPHISQVYETWTLQLKNENAIVCMDKYMDGTTDIRVDRNDIVPALLDNVTIDGKIYSMPFNKSIPVLYYNKDLFKIAGLDPERPPETWDDFIEYGKKLTMVIYLNDDGSYKSHKTREQYEKENGANTFPPQKSSTCKIVWGNAFIPDPWSFENYVVQNGGRILSKDGKKSLINEPAAIEAAEHMVNKVKKHGFAVRMSGREHQNEFISGRVGMIEGTIVSKTFMQNDIKFKFGMSYMPYKKVKTSVLSGTNVAIYSCFSEEELLGAWRFIKWFTDTEQTARWGVETTYMPVRKSAYDTQIVKDTIQKDPNMKVALTMLEKIEFEPQVSSWFECRGILSKATEAICGMYDPVKTLNNAVTEMNEVLNQED